MQRGDVRAEQERLAVLAGTRRPPSSCARPGAHGLDLPALQREARLEALLDEIVEARLAVLGDEAVAGSACWPWVAVVRVRSRSGARLYREACRGGGDLGTIAVHARGQALGARRPAAEPPVRAHQRYRELSAFLPWCTHARVESRTEREIVATIGVKQGPLQASSPRATCSSPTSAILMQLVSGPFKSSKASGCSRRSAPTAAAWSSTCASRSRARLSAMLFEPLFARPSARSSTRSSPAPRAA